LGVPQTPNQAAARNYFTQKNGDAKCLTPAIPWAPTEKFCRAVRAGFRWKTSRSTGTCTSAAAPGARDCVRRATKDWRQRNRERVNAERRVAYREQHPLPERPCIVCGEPFGKRADALVCGERCRNQRKDEQRKAAGLMPTT
jgi:hypothetical protein